MQPKFTAEADDHPDMIGGRQEPRGGEMTEAAVVTGHSMAIVGRRQGFPGLLVLQVAVFGRRGRLNRLVRFTVPAEWHGRRRDRLHREPEGGKDEQEEREAAAHGLGRLLLLDLDDDDADVSTNLLGLEANPVAVFDLGESRSVLDLKIPGQRTEADIVDRAMDERYLRAFPIDVHDHAIRPNGGRGLHRGWRSAG